MKAFHNRVQKTKTHRFATNSEHILADRKVGVGVDQGRPFEADFLVLARSGRRRMSHPVQRAPALRFTGERNGSQEILMGTTATDQTPPIGTLRQSPCSGTHPPHTKGRTPKVAHQRSRTRDQGR